MRRNLLVFYPTFIDNNGHECIYLDLLKNISKKYNLSLKIFVPKENNIKENSIITKVLEQYKKNFLNYFFYVIKNFRNTKFINKNISENIFFIDSQIIPFYIYFFFLIFFSKIKISFLILILRGKPNYLKFYFYKLLLKILKSKKLISIRVFVDNDDIKKYLKKNFQINSDILLTFHSIKKKYLKKNDHKNINLLCPGAYRIEKYGKNLYQFLDFYNDKNTTLNINERSNLLQKNIILKINFFHDNLERKKYDNLFSLSDAILLPYDSEYYRNRTSGIFFESIKSKKIVFVTSKTIMAKELKKAKLFDLVVSDWKRLNSKKIYFILKSKKIKKLLGRLSLKYNFDHSLKKTVDQFFFLKN
jgi:hypothetical protein